MSSLVTRKEIRSLPAAELEKLRQAFKVLQAKTRGEGYQKLAGYHTTYCPHIDPIGNALFLPWHRAYLFAFESALRLIDPDVSLPYWDWTSSDSVANGIPEAFSAKEYQLPNGTKLPNPLFSALIGPTSQQTKRNPHPPVELKTYGDQVALAMKKTMFIDFSFTLEGPHNNVHVWVGGDMGSMKDGYPAYDPLFWAHHANVDRQWAQWQDDPNNAPTPSYILDLSLDPFGVKAVKVNDYRKDLGYEYDTFSVSAFSNLVRANDKGSFQMGSLESLRSRVLLHVRGLGMSVDSFHVNIFINQPDADVNTPLAGNKHYAGSFGLFGMGEHMRHATPASGARHRPHASPGDELKNVPFGEQVLDITETLEKVGKKGQEIDIKLVATDANGKPVSFNQVPVQGLSLTKEIA